MVMVSRDAAKAVAKGRNVPAKHVVKIVGDARPNQEVLVVDENLNVVAVGRLTISTDELAGLSKGFVVRIRRSVE